MKYIEKIKSEDLAAQVQDANPGNFAIEQEVAQLVGATVPAPTAPSADDARELGAQLLVFLRRALTPIQSALRTALAAIYAHLDSRCTAYTPAAYAPYQPLPSYDPMRPFVPRTLPNLLTAITAFSARKISNGSAQNDGIPDGVSLARLLAADYSAVTKLVDDTQGWTLLRSMPTVFPNAKDITLRCKEIICKQSNYPYGVMTVFNAMDNIDLPDVEYIGMENGVSYGFTYYGAYLTTSLSAQTIRIPKLKKLYNSTGGSLFGSLPNCTKIELPSLADIRTCGSGWLGTGTGTLCLSSSAPECLEVITNIGGDTNGNNASADYRFIVAPKLQKLVLGGVLSGRNDKGLFNTTSTDLIDIEIGGATCDLHMENWNPTNVLADADKTATFLQNFKNHIALRLTSNGRGLTLTLHRDVVDAIDAAEATYGIRHIICNQKGWTISPAPTA